MAKGISMRTLALDFRKLTIALCAVAAMGTATDARAQNVAPTISGTPVTSIVGGSQYSFQPTAADVNGDTLSFAASNLPRWASFDRATGRLYGRPSWIFNGSTSKPITITGSDGKLKASLPAFQIKVTSGGIPTIAGSPATSVTEGASYAFAPTASDPEGAKLTFSVANKPAWASFSRSTGQLSGTPAVGTAGAYAGITISVSDGSATSSLPAFSITVAASNDSLRTGSAPTISGTAPGTVEAGNLYTFAPTASDPDSQALSFSVTGKPAWLTFDTASGRLSGTPTTAEIGTYANIVVTVSDGTNSTSLAPFGITVNAPAVSGSATLSWQPPQQNVDGTPVVGLAGYRVRYGLSAAALDKVLEIPSAVVTSAAVERLGAGTWYFAVKAYTVANVESDLSAIVQKTIN
jgi:hypothetical protein